ncbi:hypothetical protein [Paralimibaculum aggregatum]|nr:hypothetical protein [Limibaculum sp. NKW23]
MGCNLMQEEAPPLAATPDTISLREPGCYTVDLFREVKINRTKGLPKKYAAFLGEWGNGVWNGKWCHDLLIHTVTADGTVELLDMHAPSEHYRQPASIFKRKGQIRDDGVLYFAHGLTTRQYKIGKDGFLYGYAEGQPWGDARIVMSRKGVVPLPRARPGPGGLSEPGEGEVETVLAAAGPVPKPLPAVVARPGSTPALPVSGTGTSAAERVVPASFTPSGPPVPPAGTGSPLAPASAALPPRSPASGPVLAAVPKPAPAPAPKEEPGFFSRLFGTGEDAKQSE